MSRKNPGLYALIDDEDYELVSGYTNWYPLLTRRVNVTNVYAIADVKKDDGAPTTIRMHRLILETSLLVDHIDHNGLNNVRSNLRECTRTQNQGNSRSFRGSSSFKGVYLNKPNGRWIARIGISSGRKIYLGSFVNEREAAVAYDIKAREVFGEFAYTNFTPEEL